MYLQKEKLQHINSIVHEGKVVLCATDADGVISYTVKQDGFEDSYLNTPAEERTGWENWQTLEFPDEADDKSVIDQEKAELTHQQDASKFLLKSRYKTKDETAVAPVQLVSALGHIYVFRQSKSNTLLVDRFVLDGMTNKLNRKLEVRFKRSKQKHTPTKNMNKGTNGLVNIDTLDFRDANGNFFYEPTTEICAVNNLKEGWFSVVLVPTIENDVNRWHIFAYNNQSKKIELTTIRASAEGMFDVKDYTFFDEAHGTLIPRKIPGIIKRTLDIKGGTVTNGLAATKYDLQEEKETQSGEKQLLKTATQLMLAIPTDKGTAAFSFAIAKDGTLAEIGTTPESTIIRSKQKEILLPLNTLDEIKALGKSTPPSQGIITGLQDAENLVKISTDTKAKQLENGDFVKITGNSDYQGFYSTQKVDDNTFEIVLPPQVENLGCWEKEDKEEGRLTFDGRITAYQKTADGKLQIFCENHGLNNGDEVQISGTDSYNDTYPIQKIDDTHFVIVRKWATGEAINVKLLSQKRRGLVFDGVNDYVSLPDIYQDFSQGFTVEAWVWYDSFQSWSRIIDFGNGENADNIILCNSDTSKNIEFRVFNQNIQQSVSALNVLETNQWIHIAATIDSLGNATIYINAKEIQIGKIHLPRTLKRSSNYIGKSNWEGKKYFHGKISDVRIWKVARTADELKNNMYLQLTGKEVGLVGYWRLGGFSEGKVIDFSVNGNDGTVYGDPFVSAVKLDRKLAAGGTDAVKYSNPELFAVSERSTYEESFEFKVAPDNLALNNSGLVFDGVDDYVYLPNIYQDFSQGLTVEAWVWYDSLKSSIIEFYAEDRRGVVGGIKFGCDEKSSKLLLNIAREYNNKQNLTAPEALETGKWLHLAATIDSSGNAQLYKNGEVIQTGKIWLPNTTRTWNQNYIGGNRSTGYIHGQISDLRIWQVARTAEEIKNNMYLELTGKEVDLVGYWPLTSIIDGKVIDLAKENNGTVHGAIVGAATLERRRPDGKESKIFSFAYWGKTSQSAEGKKTIPAEYIKQNQFEDLDNGWYRASCNVTIPNGISMLRSFEIKDLGDWESLEIRKHRIRLLSDSITEAKYADSVSLDIFADSQATLATKLKELESKEEKEGELLKEKRELADKITDSKRVDIEALISQLKKEITHLDNEITSLKEKYDRQLKNPFNYYCTIRPKQKNNLVLDGWGANCRVGTEVKLNLYNGGNNQLWKFTQRNECFEIQVKQNDVVLEGWGGNCQIGTEVKLNLYKGGDHQLWKFTQRDDFFEIQVKQNNVVLDGWGGNCQIGTEIKLDQSHTKDNKHWDNQLWKLEPTSEQSNSNISDAKNALDNKRTQIENKKQELTRLQDIQKASQSDKNKWDARLTLLSQEILTIQKALQSLNNKFLDEFKKIQVNPQLMPEVFKDSKGLVSRAAWLAFVQPSGRLNAIETCEGNVQLSYFDTQGRKRQTNYNATKDSKNTTFEHWIPDAQMACLNFSQDSAIITLNNPLSLSISWSIEAWFVYPLPEREWNSLTRGKNADHHIHVRKGKELGIYLTNDSLGQQFYDSGFNLKSLTQGWHHLAAVGRGDTTLFYIDGKKVGDTKAKALADATTDKKKDIERAILKSTSDVYAIANDVNLGQQFGKVAEVRIWGVALSDDEIAINSKTLLSGNEPGLLAYYPMNEATGHTVSDKSGKENNGKVLGAEWWGCTAPIGKPGNNDTGNNTLISSEYSTITLENTRKTAMMRRFFAYCDRNGVTLLPDKRVEALELKWIGNAQFAPTLLGYIEGAPPVPSENLTLSDDYNGATSVELTMSEDVEFSWNRSQDSGLGGSGDFSAGLALEASAGLGYEQKVLDTKFGLRGNFEGSQQRQNDTNITASSSLSMTDKLELRGTPEETAKFPHLGQRFIPKNVGYALVVSALADVFVTRLSRSGKMVGYQVQPVDGIPPDVNTITFLINPAYTMNGSLDGMTGSSATTERFFKHVPEMRSQYGSLYPASYYRLQEAYDLKRQIEAEDKRRESYFANFDVSSVVAMVAMDRNIDKGSAPSGVSFSREEDKPNSNLTEEENQSDEEKKKKGEAKRKQDQEKAGEELEKSSAAVDKKKKEVEDQINDIEKKSQALSGLANWQRRMEDIQIRAGKRNIVNTYVWDADGGLRTEAQSFANTIQHSIGSSSSLNLGLGRESDFEVGSVYAGLNSQVTFSLTQTISKTESRSKGIQLNIDLGGLEYKGITDFNDRPILPGEKVDRYRFMSFYLEGSTQNFHDFFSYVVDPEWLQSNSEEARALRQTQAGKPNKAWRVLHRVTYVERPALMGFGRDLRKLGDSDQATAEILDYFSQLEIRHQELKAENQELNGKIAKVQKELLDGNQQLQSKLDQILALIAQKPNP
ncbi:LamG-like jellyroll fold domain-containing protein [Microcoleus sp. Z1_C3]|uniref:LamG-like jellyroll fold domain-containing protein n=1 Tax=unclassified Microcoleus TaxID=2642155 RepID=UPI002FCFACDC